MHMLFARWKCQTASGSACRGKHGAFLAESGPERALGQGPLGHVAQTSQAVELSPHPVHSRVGPMSTARKPSPKQDKTATLLEPDPKKARLDVAKTVAKALAVPPLPKPPAQTAGVEVAGDSGSRAGNAAASAAPRGPEALAPQAEVGHAVSGLVDAASVTLPADGRVGQDDPFPDAEAKVDAQKVEQWLRVAVKKVQEGLPQVLQSNREHPGLESLKVGAPLHEQPPLQLPQTGGDGGAMSSYKAGWDKSLALPSLRTTGMYEASANITWLNPYCGTGAARIIAGDPIEWVQLCQVSDMYLGNEADQSGTLAPPQGLVKRLIFPLIAPDRKSVV